MVLIFFYLSQYTLESDIENSKSEKNFPQKELQKRLPFGRKSFSDKVLKFFDDYNIPYTDKQKRWDWINIKTALIYYQEIVYPDVKGKLNSDDYCLKNGEALTLEQIRKYGHLDFEKACRYRGIKYNDILRGVGLKINKETNRWEGLDLGKAGEHLLNILNGEFSDFVSACRCRGII